MKTCAFVRTGPKALIAEAIAVLGLAALCRYRLHVLWFPVTFGDLLTVAAFGVCCLGAFTAICDAMGSQAVKHFRRSYGGVARAVLLLPSALAIALFCLGLELGTAWIFILPGKWRRPPFHLGDWIAALVLAALLWIWVFGRLWWKERRGDPMPEE